MQIRTIATAALLLLTSLAHAQHKTDPPVAPSEPRIQFRIDADANYSIEVANLDKENLSILSELQKKKVLEQVLSVEAKANDDREPSPLDGKCELLNRRLVFRPTLHLRPGETYEVQFRLPNQSKLLVRKLTVPKLDAVPTKIEAVYPSSVILPANTRKFHLRFSAPMRQSDISEFIELRTSAGKPLKKPLLDQEQVTWNEEGTQVLLVVLPRRVTGKTGKDQWVSRFDKGEKYQLVVSQRWPDATGKPLASGIVKPFQADQQDEEQPNPRNWKWKTPPAGSQETLVIELDESLDQAMLHQVIKIIGPDGQRLKGTIRVTANEKIWQFKPARAWATGSYNLEVASRLEDLAGNTIDRRFDFESAQRAEPPTPDTSIRIPFRISERN